MLEKKRLSNGWEHFVSQSVEQFPAAAVVQAQAALAKWEGVFPRGTTWVGDAARSGIGKPSLFVRFDCMWDGEGLGICEIEDRPCGIGSTSLLNPDFAERLAYLRKRWPAFSWVKDPTRLTDDELWLGPGLSLQDAIELKAEEPGALFLVRSRPENASYHVLEDRAVSPVSKEGNKQYGEELGLWSKARYVQGAGLDDPGYLEPELQGSCFAKPPVCTRAYRITPYIEEADRSRVAYRKGECNSLRAVERLAEKYHHIYIQPLIQPMHFKHLAALDSAYEKHNGLYRMYFGYDPGAQEWMPMGGLWAAAKSLIVHGAEKTVFGPLVCH